MCDTGKETTETKPTAAMEEYEVNEGAWDQHSELQGQRTSFRQAKKQAYSGSNEQLALKHLELGIRNRETRSREDGWKAIILA